MIKIKQSDCSIAGPIFSVGPRTVANDPARSRLKIFSRFSYGFRFRKFLKPFKSNSLSLLFWLKERVTLKASILCLSSSKASNHSAFPLTDVSACKVPAILKKFVSKEATSEALILKLSSQPDRAYETSSRTTRNWRAREKRGILHKVSKIHFFQRDHRWPKLDI